ncbi:MAG TPA: ABC transporter ATP-binding protein [Candidatus Wallbacteria bacterium]|nr:ABC transporter ATP-binding protein [Candidatus Wallbacteria bacterium]
MTNKDIAIIKIDSLHKRFNNAREALSGVDLLFEAGSVLGLIGKNGAGKTTLIKTIMGFLNPTSGSVSVLGKAPSEISGSVGYVPDKPEFHLLFTGREYLYHLSRISGKNDGDAKAKTAGLLELTDMSHNADKTMNKYSRGMLQRIGIAQAMITDPEIVIMDEPFSNLDPAGQAELCDMIIKLKTAGKSLIVSSHDLSNAEKVCTHIALMDAGKVPVYGPMRELLSERGKYYIDISGFTADRHERLFSGHKIEPAGEGRYILAEMEKGEKEALLNKLLGAGITINEFGPAKRSLDEFYGAHLKMNTK